MLLFTQMLLCRQRQGRWAITLAASSPPPISSSHYPHPSFHPCTKVGFVQETEFSTCKECCCVIYVSQAQPEANMTLAGIWKLLIPKACFGVRWSWLYVTTRNGQENPNQTPGSKGKLLLIALFNILFFPHSTNISRILKFPSVYQHLLNKKSIKNQILPPSTEWEIFPETKKWQCEGGFQN